MKWLLLDTALDGCLAAIAEDARILAVQDGQDFPGRGHAEKLLPAIEAARLAAGITLADLDALAVTTGPGSFTGIRTALSVARGLSLALRRPLWGLSTTQALALQGAEAGRATVALIDARRGEVYMQAFAAADQGLGPAFGPPALLPLEQAIAALPPGRLCLVGSGAALLPAHEAWQVSPAAPAPLAGSLLHLARLAASDWQIGDKMPAPPKPLYIRAPDAALPKVAQPAASLMVRLVPVDAMQAALLSRLHAEGFHEAWDEAAFVALLAMPGAFALLALDGAEQPAGFALGRIAADEAEVISIAVRPRLRQLGIGGVLLRGLAAEAARLGAGSLFLEVAEGNLAAQALYHACGFKQVGRRKDYYDKPRNSPEQPPMREAALVMRADIVAKNTTE
ncbi:tRNA (adenosine(37)-N6)-threonylcarbamoyltransferase complex dimerization subunit type 1 TsaB [Ferrovibrio sp.]|uniref:tRNA (adenosine(37)-N6)-threonylcarbamoyltransferase complex dimerization subunit type 1 TsaB n=1 Tax=Ferrovibrio sp. TaxID=1917215 RepID=UPI001B42F267|nr:tRNA (adenosine(37)-N6)-threonylcarbamoyltransferase complex dimerization subunit type 1 TsaB [Ferrovibrio sp.]MBP7062587.1 tRNA (adenosine(37)-N6)-threonylcarbamoyltransferase complex dimerization subunit type 1 TsaB [Ferrovibrio sp.]